MEERMYTSTETIAAMMMAANEAIESYKGALKKGEAVGFWIGCLVTSAVFYAIGSYVDWKEKKEPKGKHFYEEEI